MSPLDTRIAGLDTYKDCTEFHSFAEVLSSDVSAQNIEIGSLQTLVQRLLCPISSHLTRRWFAFVLLYILKSSDAALGIFVTSAEIDRQAVVDVLHSSCSEDLKLVVGCIIRLLGDSQHAPQSFPQTQGSQWVEEFQEFLSALSDERPVDDSDIFLSWASAVSADGKLLTGAGGRVLMTFVEGVLSFGVLGESLQFVDIPITHITSVAFAQPYAESEKRRSSILRLNEVSIDLEPSTYLIDGRTTTARKIVAILPNIEEAKEAVIAIRTSILTTSKSKAQIEPDTDSNQNIAASRKQLIAPKTSKTNLKQDVGTYSPSHKLIDRMRGNSPVKEITAKTRSISKKVAENASKNVSSKRSIAQTKAQASRHAMTNLPVNKKLSDSTEYKSKIISFQSPGGPRNQGVLPKAIARTRTIEKVLENVKHNHETPRDQYEDYQFNACEEGYSMHDTTKEMTRLDTKPNDDERASKRLKRSLSDISGKGDVTNHSKTDPIATRPSPLSPSDRQSEEFQRKRRLNPHASEGDLVVLDEQTPNDAAVNKDKAHEDLTSSPPVPRVVEAQEIFPPPHILAEMYENKSSSAERREDAAAKSGRSEASNSAAVKIPQRSVNDDDNELVNAIHRSSKLILKRDDHSDTVAQLKPMVEGSPLSSPRPDNEDRVERIVEPSITLLTPQRRRPRKPALGKPKTMTQVDINGSPYRRPFLPLPFHEPRDTEAQPHCAKTRNFQELLATEMPKLPPGVQSPSIIGNKRETIPRETHRSNGYTNDQLQSQTQRQYKVATKQASSPMSSTTSTPNSRHATSNSKKTTEKPAHWTAALDPYQRGVSDALSEITKHLVQETAASVELAKRTISSYQTNSKKLLDALNAEHEAEYISVSAKITKSRRRIEDGCKGLVAELRNGDRLAKGCSVQRESHVDRVSANQRMLEDAEKWMALYRKALPVSETSV